MLDLNLKHLEVQKLPHPEVLILTANAGVPQRGSPFFRHDIYPRIAKPSKI